MAGAPRGNTNRADNKRFKLALQSALEKRGTDKVDALEQLADKLVAEGMGGNIQAIREVLDTLDGKPMQQIDLKGELNQKVSYTVKGIGKP